MPGRDGRAANRAATAAGESRTVTAHPTHRRALLRATPALAAAPLAALAVLAPTAARAAAPRALDTVEGTLSASNFAAFAGAVSRNLDGVLRLRVQATLATRRSGLTAEVSDGLLLLYVSGGDTQVSARQGFTRRDGRAVLDGVFAVRGAGMNQGIVALFLEPAPAPPGATPRRITLR